MQFVINLKNLIEKKYKIIIIMFFIVFLLFGLLAVKDYGITWDELSQKDLGNEAVKLILNNDNSIYEKINKYHGTTFTFVLTIIQRVFNIDNLRSIFLLRHYSTFLLFYISVIFFYLLCRNIFKNWKLGLLGSIFLVLSPRILVDSFYNPKDLPFLSFFIISIFTMYQFLKTRNLKYAFLHGVATGFAAGMRIIGILIIFYTILFFIIDIIVKIEYEKSGKNPGIQKNIQNLLIYLFVSATVFLVLMPAMLPDPLNNFIAALKTMSDFPLDTNFLYLGQYISSFNIPWHYLPVNILVMTPIPYTIFFLIGFIFFISRFRKKAAGFYIENKFIIMAVIWFFIPVIGVILLKSNMYNGWRQMYFIYPALLIISLNGIKSVYDSLFKIKTKYSNFAVIIFTIALIFIQLFIAQLMVRLHPYEFVYYNMIAGRDLGEIQKKFILDYWALGYKDGIEYILKTDDREKITYTTREGGREAAEYMFPDREIDRLYFVNNLNQAEYLIINHRFKEDEYLNPKNKVYSLVMDGGEVITVYRLKFYPYYEK